MQPVAEAPEPRIGYRVAFGGDAIPELGEGSHLACLFYVADSGVAEERDATNQAREVVFSDLTGSLDGVEHGNRTGQRVGDFVDGAGSRFLQVVAADVDRVPHRDVVKGPRDDVGREPHRGLGGKDVRTA